MSSDAIWQRYGESDPYYGVLTLDAYRKDNIAANKGAFFASGERSVERVLAQVEAAVGPVRRDHAVDFGAGVGRLSLPLGRRFADVTSIDVSPGMLRELRSNATAQSVPNLTLCNRVDEVSKPIDFAMSLIVLQHIDPQRGRDVILGIADRLAPGGVLALDVPIMSRRSRGWHLVRRLRDRVPFAQTAWNLLRGRPLHDGGMQMNLYPVAEITEALFARGMASVTLLPTEPDPYFAGALIVCRKAG
ncbi:class I SAM-dependent methyltransferase [Methylobacterium sp. WL9]|uniref:class I SAM-dependent methyltransferase n=1 Tax=Methylobacterium sp. WL9 TaxID=2603898 RepID=UPI0016501834|nr:class I SAM-dependent methyltransferase [Methylobacterium sp. WL9]